MVLRILERLVLYALMRILFIAILSMLFLFTILMAFNLSNIYLTVNEAMTKQAQAIFHQIPKEEVNQYFTSNYINTQFQELYDSYDRFDVVSYKHDVVIHMRLFWPWQKRIIVIVEDRVYDIKTSTSPKSNVNDKVSIPQWDGASKKLSLVHYGGKWKVDGISG